MQFELVADGHIQLVFKRDTIEEACEYVKNEIAGNGAWKSLAELDPDKCRIRKLKMSYDYWDLDGNPAEKI